MMRSWPVRLSLISLMWLSVPPIQASAQTASSVQQLFKDGYAQQNKGNYTKALQIWNQVIQKNPDEPAAYVNRGITRYLMRDLKGAAGDLSEAIQRKDNYANAYFNRAVVLSDLKEYDAAVVDYQKYLELAPNAPDSVQARNMLESLRKRIAARPSAPTTTIASRPIAPSQPPAPPREPAPVTPEASRPRPAALPQAAVTPPPEVPPLIGSLGRPIDTPVTAEPTATNPAPPRPLPPSPPRTGTGVSVGRISGYDATTDDLLLGLRLGVERKVLSPRASVYKRTQNFVVRMKQGSTVDDALAATGLDRQAFIRLAWRGAAWRTYKIYIK